MLDIRMGLDGYWHAAVRSSRDDKLHSVASGPCRETVEAEAQERVLDSLQGFLGGSSRNTWNRVLFGKDAALEEVRRS